MKWLIRLLYFFDRKDRHYVSEADCFLQAFDAAHPTFSQSQLKEIAKDRDIFNRPKKGKIT